MPTGTAALKQLVCEQIASLDIYGDNVSVMSGWDAVSTYLLKLCLRAKLLDEGEVRIEIHKRLLNLGRNCYEQHMKTQTYPDHVSSPHALAYAIHNDVFTRVELESIEFDHGETLETFMAGEIHDLPEKILDKLKRWKKPEDYAADWKVCC
jgi:hypothetical protein